MERCCTGYDDISQKSSYRTAQKEYKRILMNMEAIGLSDDICESNYFNKCYGSKRVREIK